MNKNLTQRVRKSISYMLVGLGICVCTPAWSSSYSFTLISPLVDPIYGPGSNFATSINNAGQVVGYTSSSSSRPWIWSGGETIELHSYGSSGYAMSINDAGQVAGYERYGYSGELSAVIWDNRIYPTFLDGVQNYYQGSVAYAINNAGQVAGTSFGYGAFVWDAAFAVTSLGSTGFARDINDQGQVVGRLGDDAVVWNGTIPTVLDSLGGNNYAIAINNNGDIVGSSSFAGNSVTRAALWSGETLTNLGSLGGYSLAADINNHGTIVGISATEDGIYRAVSWSDGSLIDLNSLLSTDLVDAGWLLREAAGINDHGWIIGQAVNTFTNEYHAYLLAPSEVPVPAAAWLLASGLLGLIGIARRRTHATP